MSVGSMDHTLKIRVAFMIFDFIKNRIAALQPGQRYSVAPEIMEQLAMPGFAGREESPADRILENIVGSGYEFWYQSDPLGTGAVLFGRLPQPLTDGRRTYVSPDRRHHYRREGIYWVPLA